MAPARQTPPWPLGSPLSSKFWESTSSPLPHHSSLGSSKLMEKPYRKQNRRSWGRGTRGGRVPGWFPQRGWGDAQRNSLKSQLPRLNFPDSSPQGGAGVAPVRFKLIRRGPKGAALRPMGPPCLFLRVPFYLRPGSRWEGGSSQMPGSQLCANAAARISHLPRGCSCGS